MTRGESHDGRRSQDRVGKAKMCSHEPGMVARTYGPSIWETESSSAGLHRKTRYK